MPKHLSQKQRFLVAAVYLIIIALLFWLLGGTPLNLLDNSNSASVWFCSGALLIIFGVYITEPFFTRPADTITSCLSVLLALYAIGPSSELKGYWIVLVFTSVMLILSILTVIFKDSATRLSHALYFFVMSAGKAKVIFSTLYIASAYSYFANSGTMGLFILIMALWVCLCICDPVAWLVRKSTLWRQIIAKSKDVLGISTQCADISVFIIECSSTSIDNTFIGALVAIKRPINGYWICVVVSKTKLLNNDYLEVICFEENGKQITLDTMDFNHESNKTVRSLTPFQAIIIERTQLPEMILDKIDSNALFLHLGDYIGRVLP